MNEEEKFAKISVHHLFPSVFNHSGGDGELQVYIFLLKLALG